MSIARSKNLLILDACDNFPYDTLKGSNTSEAEDVKTRRLLFAIEHQVVGYMTEDVTSALLKECEKSQKWKVFVSKDQKQWWAAPKSLERLGSSCQDMEPTWDMLQKMLLEPSWKHISFKISLQGESTQSRSATISQLVNVWREEKTFRTLSGWRNELYPIYGFGKELLCNVERAASSLFGIITYGVHMTAFVRSQDGLKIWVPKRAANKQTWPGKLDNSVAGGISSGETPFNSIVREAAEEASLPESLVRQHAKSCGIVSYYLLADPVRDGGEQLHQPECEYVYDLEVDELTILKPSDSEVESFKLMTVGEVQTAMERGEFKPNCALVLLDFFTRHGILTAENEPDFFEICHRLHRRLPFPII